MLSRDLSELFLAQKSSKQNGNTFCNCLVAAFGFTMLTLLGTSYLCLAIFRSEAAHAQAKAQSAKRLLAVWNRPKLVLQTLGKLASRLQALGGERKVCRTFAQVRMSRFIIKFCGDLADQPGSVDGIRGMSGSRVSGFDTRWLPTNFPFSLIS